MKTAVLSLGIALGALAGSVQAASYSWIPTTTPNIWGLDANWTGSPGAGGPTTAGDIVTINTNIGAASTINLFNTGDAGSPVKTVGVLNIGDTNNTHSFTLAPGTGSGSLVLDNNGSGAQITQLTTSKGDTISAPITIADGGSSAGSLTVTNSATAANLLTLSGGITSTGSGPKNLIFNSSSTGGITASTGVNNAGTISNIGSAGTTTISGAIGANVTGISQSGLGSTLVLSASNSAFTGTAGVSGGTLKVGHSSALNGAALTVSGGTFDLNNFDATVSALNDGGSSAGTVVNNGASLHQLFITGTGGSFSGTIAKGSAASLKLTVQMANGGLQSLSGVNSFTGATQINNGTLSLDGTGAIGSGVGGGSSIIVSAAASGTAALIANAVNAITGTSSILLNAVNGSTNIATLNSANNFTGTITIGNSSGNTLTLADFDAIGSAGPLSASNGFIRLLSNTSGTFNTPTMNISASTVYFFVGDKTAGANQTLSMTGTVSLTSNRTLNITGTNGYRLGINTFAMAAATGNTTSLNPTTANVTVGNVVNAATATGNVTLGLAGTSNDNRVTGVIANSANIATGTTSVSVTGSNGGGKWTLSGANTYTGNTMVSVGTLIVNGSHTGGGAYTVGAAGVFGGTGTISATSFTGTAGGKLTPGDTGAGNLSLSLTGTMNLSAMSNNTGAYLFDLTSPGASDKITLLTGTLNLGTLDFSDFTFTGGTVGGSYVLFDANSPITVTLGTVSGFVSGNPAILSYDTNTNDILLTVSAVPEPHTLALVLMGSVGVFASVRRRRRASLS